MSRFRKCIYLFDANTFILMFGSGHGKKIGILRPWNKGAKKIIKKGA